MADLGNIGVGPQSRNGALGLSDFGNNGTSSISATVTVSGSPAKRRVILMHRQSRRIIAETQSNPSTGAYSFADLQGSPHKFLVIGFDEGGLNAEIADHLTAS